MKHVAIVGNSAAALSALESFRRYNQSASVTLVSEEREFAYSRVLLPYYLRRRVPYDALFIRQREYYTRLDAEVLSGVHVERVDISAGRLELADGRKIGFDRLLLATGSRPVKPPIPGLEGPAVHHLWTLADAEQLDPLLRVGARILILGSGFVALQAAWAAKQRGSDVTVIELDERILPRVLDAVAGRILHEQILTYGVAVYTGTRTDGIETDVHGGLRVFAGGIDPFSVDVVIVATGVRPNDGLLPEGREPKRPGILVDAMMASSVSGVFAAGDVARGPVASGGPPEIHALWPTAVEQGKVAGANLADAGKVYRGSLSMNVTEMFGLTVASLGRFAEGAGEEAFVRRDLPGIRYLKIVFRAGVPMGAVAIGSPESAMLLGRLRPYVRQGKVVGDPLAFLEGSNLSRTLGQLIEGRMSVLGRVALKETEPCASLL